MRGCLFELGRVPFPTLFWYITQPSTHMFNPCTFSPANHSVPATQSGASWYKLPPPQAPRSSATPAAAASSTVAGTAAAAVSGVAAASSALVLQRLVVRGALLVQVLGSNVTGALGLSRFSEQWFMLNPC